MDEVCTVFRKFCTVAPCREVYKILPGEISEKIIDESGNRWYPLSVHINREYAEQAIADSLAWSAYVDQYRNQI